MSKSRVSQVLSGSLAFIFGTFFLLFVYALVSSDRDLYFSRPVPSKLSPDRLDRNISSVTRWPQWHFSLESVNRVDQNGNPISEPTQGLKNGTLLKMNIDPKKGRSKRFFLVTEVIDYTPGKVLTLKLLKDSTDRLTRMFDRLEWTIEMTPRDQGTLIRGIVSAHTSHWRSRFFGLFAEKILLNQTFYGDLIKLSELRQPFSTDLPSQSGSASIISP